VESVRLACLYGSLITDVILPFSTKLSHFATALPLLLSPSFLSKTFHISCIDGGRNGCGLGTL